jgi:hypothetical protein
MKLTTYQLRTGEGRPIRKATRATLDDGSVIAFSERMTRREVEAYLARQSTDRVGIRTRGMA